VTLGHDFFAKGHFHSPETHEEMVVLFKRSVSNVVVEISSFCNRKCSYCPVSQVERSRENRLLPDQIFDRVVTDLASIDYERSVCLNLYNEPTSDRELLLKRVSVLRQEVPKCRIYFSTNGDYLNRDYLHELVDAGLSELYVTLHAPRGASYSDAYVVGRFSEFAARMGKQIKVDTVLPQQSVQGTMNLFGIKLHVFATNYDLYGSDRAGAIQNLSAKAPKRMAPCDRPFNDFTISYDGTVFPCCQMFADNDLHRQRYAIGNMADYSSMFEAYASRDMAGWRRTLLRFGPKASPCDTCSEANHEGSAEERRVRDVIYQNLIGQPPEDEVVRVEPGRVSGAPKRRLLPRFQIFRQ